MSLVLQHAFYHHTFLEIINCSALNVIYLDSFLAAKIIYYIHLFLSCLKLCNISSVFAQVEDPVSASVCTDDLPPVIVEWNRNVTSFVAKTVRLYEQFPCTQYHEAETVEGNVDAPSTHR